METLNLNLDAKTLETCLKSINNFGYTVYQNICTGQQNLVHWGDADWFLVVFLFGIGLIVLLIFVGFLAFVVKEMILG